jgi:hypothetical protein
MTSRKIRKKRRWLNSQLTPSRSETLFTINELPTEKNDRRHLEKRCRFFQESRKNREAVSEAKEAGKQRHRAGENCLFEIVHKKSTAPLFHDVSGCCFSFHCVASGNSLLRCHRFFDAFYRESRNFLFFSRFLGGQNDGKLA